MVIQLTENKKKKHVLQFVSVVEKSFEVFPKHQDVIKKNIKLLISIEQVWHWHSDEWFNYIKKVQD